MAETEEPTDMYHFLEAIEAVIKVADPAQREALAKTMDAYQEDCREDFYGPLEGRRLLFYKLDEDNRQGLSLRRAIEAAPP